MVLEQLCHRWRGRSLDAVRPVANNCSIVRKVIALALSLAVQAAALGTPLVHAHPDGHTTGHHRAREVHAHWGGHAHSHQSSDGPALETANDDRAVFLPALVAVAASSCSTPAVTVGRYDLPVPRERAPHRVVDIAHGHDPPCFRSLSSRAPPSFAS